MKFPLYFTGLFVCLCVSACGGLDSLVTGSGLGDDTLSSSQNSCPSSDADCYLENMVLINEAGDELDLVSLDGMSLPASTFSAQAPSITSVTLFNSASSMQIASTEGVYPIFVNWIDPAAGQTPGFCMQLCPRNARCSSTSYRCHRGARDGLVSGTWRTWLGYRVGPAGEAGTTEDLLLNVYPIVGAPGGSGDEPIGILEDAVDQGEQLADVGADQILVGPAYEIEQTVIATGESSDTQDDDEEENQGSVADGGACTASSQCSVSCLSTRNCVRGISCSCAGSAANGVCYGGSCNGVGGDCGDGVNACCVGFSCTNGTCVSSASSTCF